ncbi:MAG: hypothetical protein AAFN74_09000 [Myxococcota bacterium]
MSEPVSFETPCAPSIPGPRVSDAEKSVRIQPSPPTPNEAIDRPLSRPFHRSARRFQVELPSTLYTEEGTITSFVSFLTSPCLAADGAWSTEFSYMSFVYIQSGHLTVDLQDHLPALEVEQGTVVAIRPSMAVNFRCCSAQQPFRAIVLSYPESSLFDPVMSFEPLHTRGALLHKPPAYIHSIFKKLAESEGRAELAASRAFAMRALFYGLMGDHEIRSLLA